MMNKSYFRGNPTDQDLVVHYRHLFDKVLSINPHTKSFNAQIYPVDPNHCNHLTIAEDVGHSRATLEDYIDRLTLHSFEGSTGPLFMYQCTLRLQHDITYGALKKSMHSWLLSNKVFLNQETIGLNLRSLAWVKGVNTATTNTAYLARDVTQACIDLYNGPPTNKISQELRRNYGKWLTTAGFSLTSNTTQHRPWLILVSCSCRLIMIFLT